MAFSMGWDDEAKTVFRYRADGEWTWKDFYKHVRLSVFGFDRVGHPIETIVDLSKSTRLPAGALGHLRGLGKQDHANRQPRVVIIGVPAELQAQLGGQNGVYQTGEQVIRFVDTDDEARQVVAAWQAGEQP